MMAFSRVGAFRRLLGFILPLFFFVTVFSLTHFNRVFEYDHDEGLYLMRAYLHLKGFVLYKDIWLDQPPVMVLLLSGLFKIFGPSVYVARLFILIFSTLLIWALYQMVAKTQNTLSAVLAAIFIISSSYYVKMSVTATATVPSVALAALSLYAIFLYGQGRRKRYLLASGGLFALALLTRFLAITFLPAIVCAIALIEKNKELKVSRPAGLIRAYTWWLTAFAIVFLYIVFAATRVDFSQIMQSYVSAKKTSFALPYNIFYWFREDYDLAFLVIIAIIFLIRRRPSFIWIPLTSFIAGILIFLGQNPLWYYHRIYLVVFMCWLASFGFDKAYIRVNQNWKNRGKRLGLKETVIFSFLFTVLAVAIAGIPLIKYKRIEGELREVVPGSPYVVKLMKQYSKDVHLVVTDSPIYAFYADMPIPPYLASCSKKIMLSGLLTVSDYLEVIRREQPELILFARFPELGDKIAPQIQNDYRLEYANPIFPEQLYVFKKIKDAGR